MIIDCAHYKDGRRHGKGPMSLEEAATRRAEGGFVWLGLFEPGEEELAQVRRLFGLHELAVEALLFSWLRYGMPKRDISAARQGSPADRG
jgi:Mg2+ and Co2+ transporter CorA